MGANLPRKFELELRAVTAAEHGLLAQLCNVAMLDYGRVSKIMAASDSRHLGLDEGLALLQAGVMMEHPAVTSICDRAFAFYLERPTPARKGKRPAHVPAVQMNGNWHDDGLAVMQALATAMHDNPATTKDMTPAERSRVKAAALGMRHALNTILEELA